MIHTATKTGRPLQEDTIWSIFLQLTLALHHCHYPADRSYDDVAFLTGAKPVHGRREQVLHRDLKPENGKLASLAIRD
jgi:serine/threonine protein kinase